MTCSQMGLIRHDGNAGTDTCLHAEILKSFSRDRVSRVSPHITYWRKLFGCALICWNYLQDGF